jgi:hypothetical protein
MPNAPIYWLCRRASYFSWIPCIHPHPDLVAKHSSNRQILSAGGNGFVVMTGIGTVFAFLIYRKRVREKIWQLAMAGWQNNTQRNAVIQEQSAVYLSEMELEKLAA